MLAGGDADGDRRATLASATNLPPDISAKRAGRGDKRRKNTFVSLAGVSWTSLRSTLSPDVNRCGRDGFA